MVFEEHLFVPFCDPVVTKHLYTFLYHYLLLLLLFIPLVNSLNRKYFYEKDDLAGKLVVITGAAGGIGRYLALEFARVGASISLWDNRKDALDSVRDWLVSDHGVRSDTIHLSNLDISDAAAVMAAASSLKAEMGIAQIIISNAAVMRGKTILDTSNDELKKDFCLNTLGTFWMARAFLPQMLSMASPCGTFAIVSSVLADIPAAYLAEYCASKAAVKQFHECLRWELSLNKDATNIRTLLIQPYAVNTALIKGAALLGNRVGQWRFAALRTIMPVLSPKFVAKRIVCAVQIRERNVFIPMIAGPTIKVINLLPLIIKEGIYAFCGVKDGMAGCGTCMHAATHPVDM